MDQNDDKKSNKDDRKKVTQLDKVDRDLNFKMERLIKRKEQLVEPPLHECGDEVRLDGPDRHRQHGALTMRANERETLLAFARGEATWAEVEGITAADAARIAGTGVRAGTGGEAEGGGAGLRGDGGHQPEGRGGARRAGHRVPEARTGPRTRSEYGEALARDPAHPVALGNRGELLLRLGRREGFGDVAAAVAADPEGRTAAGRRAARLAKAITADAVARLGLQ